MKHTRDQYQDNNDPSHNVRDHNIIYNTVGAMLRDGIKEPLLAVPEFDDAGGFVPFWPKNPDPPPEIGTSSIQGFVRGLSYAENQGEFEGFFRGDTPTAVIYSIDNGSTWQFLTEYTKANE